MIELIPSHTNFDFVGIRKPAMLISLALNAVALLLLLFWGPKLGIDFAGGSLVQVRFSEPTKTDTIRASLAGFESAPLDIQDLGSGGTEFLLRVPLSEQNAEGVNRRLTTALAEKFGKDKVEVLRVEAVGPRVGQDLRRKAVLAVVFATLMMAAYISLRFEWRFGVGAAVALVHDVLIATGALLLLGYEFDLTVVPALLTVVGYSVHDTVIVSDRIRENRRKDRRASLAQIINQSINETLSRSILTSGTAVLVVLALFVLGGPVLHGFAFTLLIGFTVGTYSSIFIASPVVLYFEGKSSSAVASDSRPGRAPAPRAARRT
jgi:preprotein translocase subunit SecF